MRGDHTIHLNMIEAIIIMMIIQRGRSTWIAILEKYREAPFSCTALLLQKYALFLVGTSPFVRNRPLIENVIRDASADVLGSGVVGIPKAIINSVSLG